MRRTYVELVAEARREPERHREIGEAQRKWLGLTIDDEKARFPHIDERGYYGSVLPMCLGNEEEGQSLARNEVLKASGLCHEDPAPGRPFLAADRELERVVLEHRAAWAADFARPSYSSIEASVRVIRGRGGARGPHEA
jgi:hypothetical protein